MALHIDEIAIQLSVGGAEDFPSSPRSKGGRSSDIDDDEDEQQSGCAELSFCARQAIVADVVQQVLKILHDREGR